MPCVIICVWMYVYVCINSQSAVGAHCDPGCIWTPEAMLAEAEMMIKDWGGGGWMGKCGLMKLR